jgi:hypothetical protein
MKIDLLVFCPGWTEPRHEQADRAQALQHERSRRKFRSVASRDLLAPGHPFQAFAKMKDKSTIKIRYSVYQFIHWLVHRCESAHCAEA